MHLHVDSKRNSSILTLTGSVNQEFVQLKDDEDQFQFLEAQLSHRQIVRRARNLYKNSREINGSQKRLEKFTQSLHIQKIIGKIQEISRITHTKLIDSRNN